MSTKFEYRAAGIFFPPPHLDPSHPRFQSESNWMRVDWIRRDHSVCTRIGEYRWGVSDYKIDPLQIRDFHLAFRSRIPGTTLAHVTKYLEQLRESHSILICHEQ